MTQEKQHPEDRLESAQIPGSPGYRTRDARARSADLDGNPEETLPEAALIRKLFTLQLRTRSPRYRLMMLLFGAGYVALAVFMFVPFVQSAFAPGANSGLLGLLTLILVLAVPFTVGAALLINLVINLLGKR